MQQVQGRMQNEEILLPPFSPVQKSAFICVHLREAGKWSP